jgi:hypothetical protein
VLRLLRLSNECVLIKYHARPRRGSQADSNDAPTPGGLRSPDVHAPPTITRHIRKVEVADFAESEASEGPEEHCHGEGETIGVSGGEQEVDGQGFGIRATQIRQGAETRKGYLRADFLDAFGRYLPPDPRHVNHRDGTAVLASHTGSRGSETVSDDGLPPRREPPSNVSDVSDDAHAEDGGA